MKINRYLSKCDEVYHTTLDPNGPGCVRIHLVPPAKMRAGVPWVAIINGYSVLPLQSGWAILLKIFMDELNKTNGQSLSDDDLKDLVANTMIECKKVFPNTPAKDMKKDLGQILQTFKDIAKGKEPSEKIGYMTLSQYSKFMSAPHRMDLMVSAMEKNGCWNCNQKCIHCYAANQKAANYRELSTPEWKEVIDRLRKANVPAITFTGGEATIRKDLVELVDYSRWFVTRLNTNGILLTKELCKRLYAASLDSVQVTLYSYDENIHNELVGGNHFKETIQGIKNALEAGLDVSINTPLCSLNKDYASTVRFAYELGVRYFSSSGLIPTGNALGDKSKVTQLSKAEITDVIKNTYSFTKEMNIELSFTSPGWIDQEDLKKMRMVVPSCGACLSNMAIAPNGDVVPCQSWLSEDSLGNILNTPFKKIWNSKRSKEIRQKAISNEQVCLLKEEK